jgi:hypothetical protein
MKTHSRLAREELGESLGHLRMAAAHAADGAAGALAPRVQHARQAVKPGLNRASDSLESLLSSNGSRKKKARKKKGTGMAGKRWPMMVGGLLATGAVVGVATALMKRRRSQPMWDEYASTRETGEKIDSRSTMDASVGKASAKADAAKDRTSDLIR